MNTKEYSFTKLFEQFISDSYKGKRLKADGTKIKKQTVNNYKYVLAYLREYELKQGVLLRIRVFRSENKRCFDVEKNYWRKFYNSFTHFLYHYKGCFDNYVGSVIKNIRVFFNYLNREKGINTGDFYKDFYSRHEEIPIVTLLPHQLRFLIGDENFTNSISPSLKKSKAIFVFGCTVALRVSDLFAIRFTDIEQVGETYYLPVRTIKTGAVVCIKLPAYAMTIVQDFKATAKNRKLIFPSIPRTRFNDHLKEISALAGWTNDTGKVRTKRGIAEEVNYTDSKRRYRFCDLVSSHTMRRTAITTMLMLGMKEHVVKQISGHANDSKSFYRYVNLVQSYLDNQVDEVFNKLAAAS